MPDYTKNRKRDFSQSFSTYTTTQESMPSQSSAKKVKTQVVKVVRPMKASRKRENERFQAKSLDPETKYISTGIATTVISTTPLVQLMNASTQGSGNGQVVGQRFRMTSFQIRGLYANTPANLAASTGLFGAAESFRCVVVYDKQTNGAAPLWSAIFNANNPWAMRALDTRDRFLVLYDSGVQTISQGGPNAWSFDHYGKMSMECTKTNTNNNNVTDIITGSVYFLCISNNSTANSPSQIQGIFRVNYIDE